MAKHRFYLSSELSKGAEAALSGQEASHLKNVLRLKVGDAVTLFKGENIEARATITEIARSEIKLLIESVTPCSRESSLEIHLYQGLSKGERMGWVIQKAVEIGVTELTPVITEHTAFSLDKKRLAKKMAHWQKIIENASSQSLRNQLMVLNEPQTFVDSLASANAELSVLLHTAKQKASLPQEKINRVGLWVGPEGGFSDSEIELAKRHHILPVQLGPRVLRTETAAITACSLMQWRYGDFASYLVT